MLGDDRFKPMDELNIRGGDMDCTKAARFFPELVFTGTEPSPSDSEFDDPTARFTRGGEDGAAKNEVDEADRPCFGCKQGNTSVQLPMDRLK
ncbi:hypothetical protein N9M16_05610 [Candidatus Dependentiae bacterium]|nr:hypothetical protein [Candidatus Dependentiae bacterium]